MIVTIVNAGSAVGTALAENLSLLHAAHGRKVLLIDAVPDHPACAWSQRRAAAGVAPRLPAIAAAAHGLALEVERLLPRYADLVIDAESGHTAGLRPALIAAHTIVVPLAMEGADLAAQDPLVAALNAARMFNPAARVLFLLVARAPLDEDSIVRARAYAAQVMAARLCRTPLIHTDQLLRGQASGRGAFELAQCACAATEVQAVYQDIFHRAAVAAH